MTADDTTRTAGKARLAAAEREARIALVAKQVLIVPIRSGWTTRVLESPIGRDVATQIVDLLDAHTPPGVLP